MTVCGESSGLIIHLSHSISSEEQPHSLITHTHTHTHTQSFFLLSLSVYPSSLVPFPHSVKHLALAFCLSHILTLTHFLSLVLLHTVSLSLSLSLCACLCV